MLQHYIDTVNNFYSAEEFDDWLLSLSDPIPTSISKEIRKKSNLVRGCEISTWLSRTESEDGPVILYDSDSRMNLGLAKIIVDVCNSTGVNNLSFYDLNEVTQFLTLNKKRGLQLMLNKIRLIMS